MEYRAHVDCLLIFNHCISGSFNDCMHYYNGHDNRQELLNLYPS
jgi:hypothetical protein